MNGTQMACLGAATRSVRTTEHMEECRACGTQIQFQFVNHPFWGFWAGCEFMRGVEAARARELAESVADAVDAIIAKVKPPAGNETDPKSRIAESNHENGESSGA